MTRFLAALLIPVLSLFISSCGCKQPPSVPKLRKMPKFDSLTTEEATPAVQAPVEEPKVIREK